MHALQYTRGLGTPATSQHNIFDSQKLSQTFLVLLKGFAPQVINLESDALPTEPPRQFAGGVQRAEPKGANCDFQSRLVTATLVASPALATRTKVTHLTPTRYGTVPILPPSPLPPCTPSGSDDD